MSRFLKNTKRRKGVGDKMGKDQKNVFDYW